MKDWEYHKKSYIQRQTENAMRWMELLEKKYSSPIERLVFIGLIEFSQEFFKDGSLSIISQSKIGRYTVDFLVVHEETNSRIVIECDGHEFHEKTKKQVSHDKKRDRFMTTSGYTVLRYTGSEICEDYYQVYEDLGEMLLGDSFKLSH